MLPPLSIPPKKPTGVHRLRPSAIKPRKDWGYTLAPLERLASSCSVAFRKCSDDCYIWRAGTLTLAAIQSTMPPLPPIRQPGLAARIHRRTKAPHRTPAFFYAYVFVRCRLPISGGGVWGAARLAGAGGRSANPHTVRHPSFTVPGGDSTQRELTMDVRYAFFRPTLRPGCFIRIGSVVPFCGRRAP